jgi:hypothetical protein
MKLYRFLILAMTIMSGVTVLSGAQSISFQGRNYQLGSFNQKNHAMWEFTSGNETVNNWTTLLTIVDRPDAKTRPDLDRLAQGVMDQYKSRGGKVLMAKTMATAAGVPFNYMIVAFEEPAQKRFELNFVKAVLGEKNAAIVVYGVRVSDPKDYVAKAKAFLSEHSQEIGKALEVSVMPSTGTLPRKEF